MHIMKYLWLVVKYYTHKSIFIINRIYKNKNLNFFNNSNNVLLKRITSDTVGIKKLIEFDKCILLHFLVFINIFLILEICLQITSTSLINVYFRNFLFFIPFAVNLLSFN